MDDAVKPIAAPTAVADFIARWNGNAGSERSKSPSFMRDLCGLLELPLSDPGKEFSRTGGAADLPRVRRPGAVRA